VKAMTTTAIARYSVVDEDECLESAGAIFRADNGDHFEIVRETEGRDEDECPIVNLFWRTLTPALIEKLLVNEYADPLTYDTEFFVRDQETGILRWRECHPRRVA
jgi:hypothetical protein